MTDKIKVACLGAGYFSKFHYDAWKRLPNVELIAATDEIADRAKATCVPAFKSLNEILENAPPDVLDIITPPESHLESIAAASKAGIRTIICQKPFCRSLKEAEQAAMLAQAAGVNLIVHENFRFQPWYRTLKQILSDGRLGETYQFTFRLRTGDGQGQDAYLDRQPYFQTMERFLIHETAVHWIDTFQYLLGPVHSVYADLRKINPVIQGEDAGIIVFEMESGARAIFDGNRNVDHAVKDTRLTFGEASLECSAGSINLLGDGSLTLRKLGEQQMETILAPQSYDGFAGDCVYALQAHVVDHLMNQAPLENQAQDYLSVMLIEELIYLSAKEGRKIRVPLL